MKPTTLTLALSLLLPAGAALADEVHTKLEVTGLYCASCPAIAAQALEQVPTVQITGGFFDPQQQLAVFEITFDDTQASTDDLIFATQGMYGYPARVLDDETNS